MYGRSEKKTVCVCVCVCIYSHAYYTRACMCMYYIYTYIRTYVHTNIHMYVCTTDEQTGTMNLWACVHGGPPPAADSFRICVICICPAIHHNSGDVWQRVRPDRTYLTFLFFRLASIDRIDPRPIPPRPTPVKSARASCFMYDDNC